MIMYFFIHSEQNINKLNVLQRLYKGNLIASLLQLSIRLSWHNVILLATLEWVPHWSWKVAALIHVP